MTVFDPFIVACIAYAAGVASGYFAPKIKGLIADLRSKNRG